MSLEWNGQWDDPGLDNEFKNDLQSVLGPDEDHWGVDKPAVRNKAVQNGLYAKGRTEPGEIVTYAKWPQGPHCHGVAGDIYRIVGMGITAKRAYDYDHPSWARIRAAIDAHPRLHGGWHFPHPDPDHVQSQQKWLAIKATLIANGEWDQP